MIANTARTLLWQTLRKFVLVGGIGFAVDALLLTLIMRGTGWPAWQARIPSFLCAVVTTWLLNRRYAFAGRGLQRRSLEAVLYASIQVSGAVLNLAIFSACLWYFPPLNRAPMVALAIGAVGGLACNFTLSNGLLYSRPPGNRN